MIEENELIQIWQSSSNQDRIKFEKSKLILEMKSSLDRFQKSLKYRDFVEFLNAIIVIPIFAYLTYSLPHVLSKIGCLLIILCVIYVIFKLKSLNQYKPNTLTDSYIEYLYQYKNYLRLQKKMRETAPYWYLLPLVTGVVLFVLGIITNLDAPISPRIIIIISSIIIGSVIFIYFYNLWIIKKHYTPRLEKMDKLIKTMEE